MPRCEHNESHRGGTGSAGSNPCRSQSPAGNGPYRTAHVPECMDTGAARGQSFDVFCKICIIILNRSTMNCTHFTRNFPRRRLSQAVILFNLGTDTFSERLTTDNETIQDAPIVLCVEAGKAVSYERSCLFVFAQAVLLNKLGKERVHCSHPSRLSPQKWKWFRQRAIQSK